MVDELWRIVDEGGTLTGVDHALFEGDSQFVTAVVLRFERLTAVFRAVSEDDTLAVTIGAHQSEESESITGVERSCSWASCLGQSLCWAWRLTNQQGYDDGVRLEFGTPGQHHLERTTVELIVAASSIELFHVVEIR
jgi:hypothetical protein